MSAVDLVHDSWRRASDTLDFTDEQRACLLAAECLRIIDPSEDPPTIPSPGPKASMAAIFVTHEPEPQFDDFAAPGSPLSPSDELPTPLDFDFASAAPLALGAKGETTFPFPSSTPSSSRPRSPSPYLSPSRSPSPTPSASSSESSDPGGRGSRPRSADGYPLPPPASSEEGQKGRKVQFATLPRPQLLRAARSPSPESAWSLSSQSPSPKKKDGRETPSAVRLLRERLRGK